MQGHLEVDVWLFAWEVRHLLETLETREPHSSDSRQTAVEVLGDLRGSERGAELEDDGDSVLAEARNTAHELDHDGEHVSARPGLVERGMHPDGFHRLVLRLRRDARLQQRVPQHREEHRKRRPRQRLHVRSGPHSFDGRGNARGRSSLLVLALLQHALQHLRHDCRHAAAAA
eukprot:3734133-Rhodomonas_salina.1